MIFKVAFSFFIGNLAICLTQVSINNDSITLPNESGDPSSDTSLRNLFLAISLTSLFIYLFSLSLSDFIAKERIPEVFNLKKIDRPNVILSKYLIKIIYGKWSSNLEFQDTNLCFEFNTLDNRLTSSIFIIPTEWLKNLMDFVGTKDSPLLKAIKFWVFQPESLGHIASVKMSLKNYRNDLPAFIYIDSIELSKVSDDKIQVVSIQKNVFFTNNGGMKPLSIKLGFKQNVKVTSYDGYTPYLSFCDYFYFYVIYIDSCFLALSYFQMNYMKTDSYFARILVNSLVNCCFCTLVIIAVSSFYLVFVKSRLSYRHNSEAYQAINVIFLSALYISIFVINYLVCESMADFNKKRNDFLIQLATLQIFFLITLLFLWLMSKFIRYHSINKMIIKSTDAEFVTPTQSTLESGGQSGSVIVTKRITGKGSFSKAGKLSSKRSGIQIKTASQMSKNSMAPTKEDGLAVKRADSDNSIGSGYYQQMITATKHVRSISQYGELLRDNKY